MTSIFSCSRLVSLNKLSIKRLAHFTVIFVVTLSNSLLLTDIATAYTLLCGNYGDSPSFFCVSYSGYSGQRTWGYPTDAKGHNCTNYVAYRLAKNGVKNPGNLGSGMEWDDNARKYGIPVDTTPAVGSIAAWGANSWPALRAGHVAYVERVTNSYIEVSEDNWNGTTMIHRYDKNQRGWPDNFIHFGKNSTTGSSSSGWNGVEGLKFKGRNNLRVGERLYGGEYLLSDDGRFVLTMQEDGNLVIYHKDRHYWNSKTQGNPGAFAQLQGDGNFVIYSSSNKPLWHTNTRDITTIRIQDDGNFVGYSASGASWWSGYVRKNDTVSQDSNKLTPGQRLGSGKYIKSADGRYYALMQVDGNFVVYAPGYKVLWHAKTYQNPGAFAQLQGDGNFVVYSLKNKPLWHTKTSGKNVSRLLIQSDGNLVLYSAGNKALWATYTHNRLK